MPRNGRRLRRRSSRRKSSRRYLVRLSFARDIGTITHSLCILAEFQLAPLPTTNPVLIGHRWKEYHEALGLKYIVDFSWEMVQKEKSDMVHLLDFPYNGETKTEHLLGDGKITKNEHHLSVSLT
jgi:hypothetical protein